MTAPQSEWFVRVRTYTDSTDVLLWLIERSGLTEHCLLSGRLLKARAERLCAHLEGQGLRIEREEAPYALREEGVSEK